MCIVHRQNQFPKPQRGDRCYLFELWIKETTHGLGLLTESSPRQHLKSDIEASPDLSRIPINREKPLPLWTVELSPDVRLHRKRLMITPQLIQSSIRLG